MTTQHKRRTLTAGAATAGLLWALTPLGAAPSADAERWMTLRFMQSTYGHEPLTRAEVENRLMPMFDQADVDGNGVSQSDYAQAERIRNAQQRASQITMILRDDLNGDGQVTRAEVTQARGQEARAQLSGGGGIRVAPTPAQISDILK